MADELGIGGQAGWTGIARLTKAGVQRTEGSLRELRMEHGGQSARRRAEVVEDVPKEPEGVGLECQGRGSQ